MTSRRLKHEKVGAFVVAVVITLVLGGCAGEEKGASQGTTKLANRTTGPAETGPETGPTQTAPPPARASAAPNVVKQSVCRSGQPGEARSRLNLAEMVDSDSFKVRFEVYRSPVGHRWRIELRHQTNPLAHWPSAVVIFEGTRVASESGDLVVQRRVPSHEVFRAKAVDTQTGQVCKIPRKGAYCRADRPCADDRGSRERDGRRQR
jgi:hypothetical protein